MPQRSEGCSVWTPLIRKAGCSSLDGCDFSNTREVTEEGHRDIILLVKHSLPTPYAQAEGHLFILRMSYLAPMGCL